MKARIKTSLNKNAQKFLNRRKKMKFEDIDKKVNEENIKLFKRYDISEDEKRIYTCVCCGRKTSIASSTSVEGAYLVCTRCVYDKFKCYRNAMKWQDEMLKKEAEENE